MSILGKMEVTIKKNLWISRLNGETERDSFRIASEKGDCYGLKFPRNMELQEVCVEGDELYLPPGEFKSVREVLTRKK